MTYRVLGPSPFEKDDKGRPKVRISTVFPKTRTVVTLPTIHAFQRLAYVDWLQEQSGRPLSDEQRQLAMDEAVDVIREDDTILIRPDPDDMDLAFAGEDVLSELFSRRQIRYLFLLKPKVRTAIKRRGENWRINPLPQCATEMCRMIARSRMVVGGRELFYYSNDTGTRFLTYQDFAALAALSNDELRMHLAGIQQLALSPLNRHGNPELYFFQAGHDFSPRQFHGLDFAHLDGNELRAGMDRLAAQFRAAVPRDLLQDDIENPEWRNRMYAALIGRKDEVVPEEILLGLSPEFFMQIEWLPGGRFEGGVFLLDPVYDQPAQVASGQEPCDEKVRAFIFNFIREYGDLEYVNVGRVVESLSRRGQVQGRREVYIAEIKPRGAADEIIKIIRMQKYGVREQLNEGKPLDRAMLASEDYSDYVLHRRLGCRQLGMNLTPRFIAGRIAEPYPAPTGGFNIWSPYFERDYVRGAATDKIPKYRYQDDAFSLRLADLLGAAAAPNMIVGRCDLDLRVVFDDGDEVVVEDERGVPREIVVVDQMGTFRDYERDLSVYAEAYAKPVLSRRSYLRNPAAFADAYLAAFVRRFTEIQSEYRSRKQAFDNMFGHRNWDPGGSFAYRWDRILQRLNRSDPHQLAAAIRQAIERQGSAAGRDSG